MENEEVLLLNELKKGSSGGMKSLKLIKKYRYAITGATLIPFIIYYFIIVTEDFDFMANNMSRFRRKPLQLESKFNTTDFHRLVNITDFKFTIQQPACPESGLDLLVLVHSSPYNFNKRQMIRRTWGSQKQNSKLGKFRVLFLLGLVELPLMQGEIILESLQFKDIVQGSFIDHYHNLTYKHVMALKWHKYFCESTKVILKCDDDVVINMPFILQSFETDFWENAQDANQDFIICPVLIGTKLERTKGIKHYVSKEEWEDDNYPPYCRGFAIFYAGHTAIKLYDESSNVPYLFVDDAFVSGFVRERIGVNVTDFGFLLNSNVEQVLSLRDAPNIGIKNFFVGPFSEDFLKLGEPLWNGLLSLANHSKTEV